MGEMNGYGLKIEKDKNKVQIGLYNKGKKEGFFYEKTGNLEKIVEYQKNYVKGQHPEIDLSKISIIFIKLRKEPNHIQLPKKRLLFIKKQNQILLIQIPSIFKLNISSQN